MQATDPYGHPPRILVVDDDQILAHCCARMLAAIGHVETAIDGLDAMSKIEAAAAPFDLIVSDIVMPRLDGPNLYGRLARTLPSYTRRFVFCTGSSLEPELLEFIAKSGCPLLPKPFDAHALRSVALSQLQVQEARTHAIQCA